MLRKEACSGSIHAPAHIPTQNCLADCFTKASAKADNLITAVQTGKLLDVDIHPDFRTPFEHKAFLSTWCKTFLHTREKEVFFLSSLKISLAQTPQEGPFQVMFLGTQQQKKQKKLNTRKRTGKDAAKNNSAPAESCIQFPRSVMSIPMTSATWMVRNISNQNTIADFTKETDDAECVRQYNSPHLLMIKLSVFGSHEPVAWCCAHFFQSGNHGGTSATLGRDVGLPQPSEGQPSVEHNSRFPSST